MFAVEGVATTAYCRHISTRARVRARIFTRAYNLSMQCCTSYVFTHMSTLMPICTYPYTYLAVRAFMHLTLLSIQMTVRMSIHVSFAHLSVGGLPRLWQIRIRLVNVAPMHCSFAWCTDPIEWR